MKYSLRSLMIVVLVLPPLLAAGWFGWQRLRQAAPAEEIQTRLTLPHRYDYDTDEEYRQDLGRWVPAGDGWLKHVPASLAPAPNPPKK